MTEKKSMLASRGVWGAAITIAAALAGLAGYQLGDDVQGSALSLLDEAAVLVGGVLALWGRVRASKRLS